MSTTRCVVCVCVFVCLVGASRACGCFVCVPTPARAPLACSQHTPPAPHTLAQPHAPKHVHDTPRHTLQRSSIVDAACTQVIDGTMVKCYLRYDNEFGYSRRLVDIAKMVAAKM